MEFDITLWLTEFQEKILQTFENRVEFIGVQGSFAREEATADSDVDIVVILDELTFDDLKKYRETLDLLPAREKICGFVSGKNELVRWEKSDLFQFYFDTKSIFGSLDFLEPLIQKSDVRRAVRIGACNLYHCCVHNFLHEKDASILKSVYKTAFFVLQARYYCENDVYISTKSDLLDLLPNEDALLLEKLQQTNWNELDSSTFEELSRSIFRWTKQTIDDARF